MIYKMYIFVMIIIIVIMIIKNMEILEELVKNNKNIRLAFS